MSSKINITRIVTEHLATLKCQGANHSYSKIDLATFYGVPALAAAMYFATMPPLARDTATHIDSVLIAAFSIFAALLLNMQILLIGLRDRMNSRIDIRMVERSPEDKLSFERLAATKLEHVTELFANVSYCILVSIALVGGTLVSIFLQVQTSPLLKSAQFFVILHFALTGIMVLKRMHVVFSQR